MQKRGEINFQMLVILIIAVAAFIALITIYKDLLSALLPK